MIAMTARRRLLRPLAALTIAASLATAALATPVLAALANIDIGGGSVVDTHARAATPQQVSPGNVAGFYLWVRNEDSANLNTFSLTARTSATPLGAYWQRPGDAGYTACTTAGNLTCNFGTLNSGDVLLIVAAFTLPGTPSTSNANCKPNASAAGFGPTTESSWVCVDFQFGSGSGNVPGKNNSRGDEYHWYDFVATDVTLDSGAGFPFCNLASSEPCDTDLLTVFNAGHASRTDLQTTQLTAPEQAFNSLSGSTGLAVRDNFAFNCPSASGVATCASHEGTGAAAFLGQWSQVDANSEQQFADYIRIDLQIYGVNANSIDGVIHLWFDGTFWHEEVIDDECPTADGPAVGQTEPCFWASGNGNVADVSIWTHNNGNYRTF